MMAPWLDKQCACQEIVKCVVVGDTACGKTRMICARACNASLSLSQILATHIPTIWAIDHYRIHKEVLKRSWSTVNGVNVSLRLWDTFGDHDKDRKFAYLRSDVVLLCFSIANRQSLRNCKTKWYPEIKSNCPNTPIILVGCKADLRHIYRDEKFLSMCREKSPSVKVVKESDLVTVEQARSFAEEIGATYYEASSLTQFGIDHVFENAIRAALVNRRQQRFWVNNLKNVKNPQVQMPYCPPRPPKPEIYVPETSYIKDMLKLLENDIKADVQLHADKANFLAHSFVLSSASPFFKNMFAEYYQSFNKLAIFQWMTGPSMKSFLKFLYSGIIEKDGDADLYQILKASQISKVKELEECIKNILDDSEHLNLDVQKKYINRLQANMRDVCANNTSSLDVTFSLDDGKCHAHRAILMARCDYMAAMFKGDFRESYDNTVKFPGVSKECFLQLLVFLYSDELDKSLNISNYFQLLELANRLCLIQLVSLIEEFAIQTFINVGRKGMDIYEHTCTILEQAQMHNAYQLSEWCMFFICINYKDILANHPTLLRMQQPQNQAYLNKNRWPPVSFLKELEYYERCIHKRAMEEHTPRLSKWSKKFRKWFKFSQKQKKIVEVEGLSDSSDY